MVGAVTEQFQVVRVDGNGEWSGQATKVSIKVLET